MKESGEDLNKPVRCGMPLLVAAGLGALVAPKNCRCGTPYTEWKQGNILFGDDVTIGWFRSCPKSTLWNFREHDEAESIPISVFLRKAGI